MSRLRQAVERILNSLWPSRREPELAREVAAHLALIEDDFVRRGMTADEARMAARRAFGGVEYTKELHRSVRSLQWLVDARWDLAYAFRTLRATPAFAATVILTLGIAVGADTAVYSMVRAVLLDPLPYAHPEQLVRVYEDVSAVDAPDGAPHRVAALDVREVLALQAQSRAFSQFVSYDIVRTMTAGADGTVRMDGFTVSVGMFPMLGVQPMLGRWFTPDEGQPGHERVVILSYEGWQRLGGDTGIVGRDLTFTANALNRRNSNGVEAQHYAVVGVMPQGFRFPDRSHFWIPRVLTPPSGAGVALTPVVGRLAPGVSPADASAEVRRIVLDVRGSGRLPPARSRRTSRFDVVRLRDDLAKPVRPAFLALSVAVGIVLLIACVNVANLLLARGVAREREIAIRVSLGAGRGRVVRQLLTESMLLAILGGLVGAGLAFWGVDAFRSLGTTLTRLDLGSVAPVPRLDAAAVSRPVLAFALLVSLTSGVLFGALPAWQHAASARPDRRAHGVLRGGLVVVEIAMATTLLLGTALLIRSFVKLANVDTGFAPAGVLTFQVDVNGAGTAPAAMRSFAEQLTDRLRALPGIEAAAYARQLPMVQLYDQIPLFVRRDGALVRLDTSPRPPDVRLVSRGYLATMGIRVVAGRGFSADDAAGRPGVLLVNETVARHEFPGGDAIGRTVYFGSPSNRAPFEIVGVVADVRELGLDRDPGPQYFVDFRQVPPDFGPPLFPLGPYFAVRTNADAAPTVSAVRALVRQLDPTAAIDNVATMDQILADAMTEQRLYTVLGGVFTVMALALAMIGLYGVIAYAVQQRTREIGIRMAVGATARDVVRMVLRQSLGLIAVGLAIGVAGAISTTRYLKTLLYGLTPLDPQTFVLTSALFVVIATIAALVPSWRAAAVDPAVTLRAE